MDSQLSEYYVDHRPDIVLNLVPSPSQHGHTTMYDDRDYLHPATYNPEFMPKSDPCLELSFSPSSPAPSTLSSTSLESLSPLSPYPYQHSMSPLSSPVNHPRLPRTAYLCECGCGGGPAVPQPRYQNPQFPFTPGYPGSIIFSMSNGRCGISLKAALDRNYSGLRHREEDMLVDCGTSISLRWQWPGCPPWTKQIKTRDWRKTPRPINRAKLATEVAKATRKFIEAMQSKAQSDPRWCVGDGPDQINVDQLVLLRLDRVSRASWQPQFRLIA